jgi:lactate permease
VLGEPIWAQRRAFGATATDMAGDRRTLFRKVLGWSIVLVLLICLIMTPQSMLALDRMVVE